MGKGPTVTEGRLGLKSYYKGKIEELEMLIKDKSHNLRRLEAQRNELNTQGTHLSSVQVLSILLGLHAAFPGRHASAGVVCKCWQSCTPWLRPSQADVTLVFGSYTTSVHGSRMSRFGALPLLAASLTSHVLACAVRLLREELQLLQEPGSYVGEVIKVCCGSSPG
jgi:hypothetical protein